MIVYLIEEAWVDALENDSARAFGYAPVGFVLTEEAATKIVSGGGAIKGCWVKSSQGASRFRWKLLGELVQRVGLCKTCGSPVERSEARCAPELDDQRADYAWQCCNRECVNRTPTATNVRDIPEWADAPDVLQFLRDRLGEIDREFGSPPTEEAEPLQQEPQLDLSKCPRCDATLFGCGLYAGNAITESYVGCLNCGYRIPSEDVK